MSLGLPQNLCHCDNPHTYIYKHWKLGKDWSSMCSKCFLHKYSLGGDTTATSGLYAWLCHAFLVTTATSLRQSQNKCQFLLTHINSSTNYEKLWDICHDMPIITEFFLPSFSKISIYMYAILNSKVTWPMFTVFSYNVGTLLSLFNTCIYKAILYSVLVSQSKEWGLWILTSAKIPRIGYHSNVLRLPQNLYQVNNRHKCVYHR